MNRRRGEPGVAADRQSEAGREGRRRIRDDFRSKSQRMAIKNLTNLWLSPNQYYRGQLRKAAGYSICAVEFDDQGELWDPEQLESTLSHIRDACTAGAEEGSGPSSKTEVIVITFIHGWMHNGTPQDLNLEHFSDLIQRRAAAEKQFAERAGRKPRSIIGVYFAWRGLLWKLPVLKYLTFWSRKTAALRVGQLSCTEAVLRISGAVKSRNNRSQCIFIAIRSVVSFSRMRSARRCLARSSGRICLTKCRTVRPIWSF